MPNPTKLQRDHRGSPLPTPPDPPATSAATLLPPLAQLADDTWLLAQKSPALPADPALLDTAGRLLAPLRRLGPDLRLVPPSFAPGIRLHALALALRQAQAALVRHLARHAPPPPRTAAEELDDITRLQALILRNLTSSVAERRAIRLPPELRPDRPPPPPPPPPGQPPPPRPHIRKILLRRENARRRVRRVGPARGAAAAEAPASRPLPRIR